MKRKQAKILLTLTSRLHLPIESKPFFYEKSKFTVYLVFSKHKIVKRSNTRIVIQGGAH